MQYKYYSELDLANAFNQMRVSPELSDLLTFTTSFGKVSYLVLPYGIKFTTDAFQFGVENHFHEFLHKAMSIYVICEHKKAACERSKRCISTL